MITYYLTLSNVFPKGHRRYGTPTFFKNMVLAATIRKKGEIFKPKIHTIRANYDFWAKRFEKIAAGEACLSIRKWVGKPYAKGSTQREIALSYNPDVEDEVYRNPLNTDGHFRRDFTKCFK